MSALLYNLVRTTLGAPLLTAGTAITFDTPLQEGGVNIPTLGGGDFIWLKINDELMHLTAYTAGATSGTVLRAQGDTIAADHNENDAVRLVSTKQDFLDRLSLPTSPVTISGSRTSDLDDIVGDLLTVFDGLNIIIDTTTP